MIVLDQILIFFQSNVAIVSFLGALVGGEETLALLTIFATRELISLWQVFIFFYLGILTSDTFWFFIGRSKIFNWLIKKHLLSKAYTHYGNLLDKSTKNNDFNALLITKFLYGFRLMTIMYLARERLTIKSFFKYSIITNFLWAGTILLISWVLSKGIITAKYLTGSITVDLALIGIVLILFMFIMRTLSLKARQWLENK